MEERLDKNSNYVNNSELLKEVILFKLNGVASEELGKMLLDIANHYTTKGNFSGYTWKKDMVGDAVLTCLKYLRSFNPDKSDNAFAYVTQICKNSFKAYIKVQKKHMEIRDVCHTRYTEIVESGDYHFNQNSIDYRIMADPAKKRKVTIKTKE